MSERKTVFITGASRGIGHATAQYFVRQGWRAITCSRDVVPAQCPRNERHAHITADLADTERLEEAIEGLHRVLAGEPLHAPRAARLVAADDRQAPALDVHADLRRQLALECPLRSLDAYPALGDVHLGALRNRDRSLADP